MKISLYFVCALMLIATDLSGQRDKDSLALIALYNSTNGPGWTNRTNWLSSQPISTWYGVIVVNGRVERLQIYNNNLSGTIPAEIGNLTNLKTLLLDYNKLTGYIPTEIGNLLNLEALYLGANQLTGSIPNEIGNLIKLVRLSLSGNQLSGPIPKEIGNLTLLKEILVNNNKLSGSIPSEIGNLVNLENLMLGNNLLSGNIPPEIGNLTNLTISLSLYYNQLSGSIPAEIGKLTNLRYLYLYNNQLSGSIPPEIVNMTSLQYLILDNNQFSGIPPELWSMYNLSSLQLSNNLISGTIPKEIGNSRLNILDLSYNVITGQIPPEIGNAPFLAYLFLNSNQLSGTIPKEICKLSKLVWLRLDNNKFTGCLPAEISNLTKLTKLWVNDNKLDEIFPFTISVLDSLWIQDNHLTFEDIEPLINVPRKFFRYSPQDSIGVHEDTDCIEGQSVSLAVLCGGAHNTYQWYKDNLLIPSAVSDIFTISNVRKADEGRYYCIISNTIATDLKLYSRQIDLTVSIVSNIPERIKNEVMLYPNPTNGKFKIDAKEDLLIGSTLEIIDQYGKIILFELLNTDKNIEFDLSHFSKGIYFLRIKNKQGLFGQKVIFN